MMAGTAGGWSGWLLYGLAWTTFLLTHFVPTRPGVRERLVGALGRRAWFMVYGAVSLIVTGWLIIAAAWAPFVELWPQAPWTRWVVNIAMPAAILIACLGLPARTVTLGGPRVTSLDAATSGFATVTRHPLLLALTVWSLAHLAPNGDLAHVLLFGGFAMVALGGMAAFDARARRLFGPDKALTYFAVTAWLGMPRHASLWPVPWIRLVVAAGLWISAIALHPLVVHVSPWPI